MNAIAMEFVFSALIMISYLIFGADLPMQTMICIYASIVLMLFRMFYARKHSKIVKNSRKAMSLWYLPHIIICAMVAIEDVFASVAVGLFGGGFLVTMVMAFITDAGLDPFENIEEDTVKRPLMYSIAFDSLGLCILDMCRNFTITKVVFTVLVAVGIVLYGEMFFKSEDESEPEEVKEESKAQEKEE